MLTSTADWKSCLLTLELALILVLRRDSCLEVSITRLRHSTQTTWSDKFGSATGWSDIHFLATREFLTRKCCGYSLCNLPTGAPGYVGVRNILGSVVVGNGFAPPDRLFEQTFATQSGCSLTLYSYDPVDIYPNFDRLRLSARCTVGVSGLSVPVVPSRKWVAQKWSKRLIASKRTTRSPLRPSVLQVGKPDMTDWSCVSLYFTDALFAVLSRTNKTVVFVNCLYVLFCIAVYCR